MVNMEEIQYAMLEGMLREITVNIEERYMGKYTITFTIEKVAAGDMG